MLFLNKIPVFLYDYFSFMGQDIVVGSLQRLASDWTVRGSKPGGGQDFFTIVRTGPEAYLPSSKKDNEALFRR
jgi:hypothetical protein